MAFVGAMPSPFLINMPGGVYTISYDIGTNAVEREPPDGWHALRGQWPVANLY
jgi:hypothetical protein